MNYYELLDVPKNATTEEIKQHYRKYAKIHHPDKGGDADLSRLETKFGSLRFAPAVPFEVGAEVVVSIRPENVSVTKEKPASAENVVQGTLHDAVFMGDAYHCQVAVGDQLIRIHTHPKHAVPVGQTVYLTLDPESCNGLSADYTEGMDDSMLGD